MNITLNIWGSFLLVVCSILIYYHSAVVCVCVCVCVYTVFRKKTPTYIFNYNSGISWSTFIIFVAVEREINTLQFTYLQSWWRHYCVTLHVTKVYFMELKMNIGRIYWETPTFVWIITLAFLGRFLYFLN